MNQEDHLFPKQEDVYSPIPLLVIGCMIKMDAVDSFKFKKKCCKKFKKGKRCGACPR